MIHFWSKKVCIVLSIILMGFILHPIYTNSSHKATVEKTHGIVQSSLNDSDWEDIQVGAQLDTNHYVQTSTDSFCDIAVDKKNKFRLKESTKVKIEKLWDLDPAKNTGIVKIISINLMEGEISSKLDDLPDGTEYEVVSPISVAGAKGTGFSIRYHRRLRRTHCQVYDHAIVVKSVSNPKQITTVKQYQSIEVAPWDNAILYADGTGVISDHIFGKGYAQNQIKNQRSIVAIGETSDEAYQQLKTILLNIHVQTELTIGSFLLQNLEKADNFYNLIDSLPLQTRNGKFAIELSLDKIESNLNISLPQRAGNIRSISLGEYGKLFGAKARVTTKRAAQIDAYRKLAESIYGIVIDSQTTVQDFATQNDIVVTKVKGLVQGAQIISSTYFSDGSVMVRLKMNGNLIPEQLSSQVGPVFGSTYMSGPNLISFSSFEEFKKIL